MTTVLDWSHIGNSPEHTDAAIDGLRASGVRAVYGFGAGVGGQPNRYPNDIRRLRKQHFSSPDQLLTLALAGGMSAKEWAVARDVGAPISVHAGGTLAGLEKALGPDVTYIHCITFTDGAWKLVAGSGGHVSIACPIEMGMGMGIPPIQQSLDHGIRPSLSVDVETRNAGRHVHADAIGLLAAADAGSPLQRRPPAGRARAADRSRRRSNSRRSPARAPTSSIARSAR